MSGFWKRLAVVPFEALIGGLAMFSGTVALLGIGTSVDSLTLLLPEWLVQALNVEYILSGVALLLGLGYAKAGVEALGLILLGAAVTVRGVAVVQAAGIDWSVAALLALYFMIDLACVARLATLRRGDVLLKLERQ